MLFLSGNVTSKIHRFDSKASLKNLIFQLLMDIATKDSNCERFYLSNKSDSSFFEGFVNNQLLAMWEYDLKDMLLMDIAVIPKDWSYKLSKLEYKEWLKNKGINEFFLNNAKWVKVN